MTYLDVWRSGTFPKTVSKRVRYRLQTRTVERLSTRRPTVLVTFLGFTWKLYRMNVPLLHTSRHVIPRDSVLPGLPPACDKRWGENVNRTVVWTLSSVSGAQYWTIISYQIIVYGAFMSVLSLWTWHLYVCCSPINTMCVICVHFFLGTLRTGSDWFTLHGNARK